MKNLGMVRIDPSNYVFRLRKGVIYKKGIGMIFFTIPSEQYIVIPTSVSKIPFVADQITKENQGVEVSGFAIWKITVPEKIYLHFNFVSDKDTITKIDNYLKDVVESAIRHQVANMTIEEVLRKRGSIILQLKKELEYISTEWGIAIETIEIKNVKIMSEQLFHNMQAKYRDQIRLESETSALKTDQEIAEKQIKHQQEIALLEQEAKMEEMKQQDETEKLKLNKLSEINKLKSEQNKEQEIRSIQNNLELFEKEEENKRIRIENKIKTLISKNKELDEKILLDLKEKESLAKIAQIENHIEKEKIQTANLEDSRHILYNNLYQIVEALDINELNIGQNELSGIINDIRKYFINKER